VWRFWDPFKIHKTKRKFVTNIYRRGKRIGIELRVRVWSHAMAGTGIHPYHQQWPPAAAAPPPPPPAAAAVPPHAGDEVRTIFITGLPEDVKERELQNLLRWLPGFEASQLNFKAEKPMGFALFSAPHQALAAKDILQDMLFDPDTKSVLHTEMAKKNLFVKRGEFILPFNL